jgi:phosphopentomutase
VLVSGHRGTEAVSLGDRDCFADLGATIAEALGVLTEGLAGRSFAELLP